MGKLSHHDFVNIVREACNNITNLGYIPIGEVVIDWFGVYAVGTDEIIETIYDEGIRRPLNGLHTCF